MLLVVTGRPATCTLDYLPSGIVFAAIILIPAIGFRFGANSIARFWFAYVITRPLGASFADYLDCPKVDHGLGIPHVFVWGTLALVMGLLVTIRVGREQATAAAEVMEFMHA